MGPLVLRGLKGPVLWHEQPSYCWACDSLTNKLAFLKGSLSLVFSGGGHRGAKGVWGPSGEAHLVINLLPGLQTRCGTCLTSQRYGG